MSQVYEALLGFAVLGILLLVDRFAGREKRPRWLLAGTFLLTYFPMGFLVEFTKEHQVFARGAPLDTGHYLSIPFAMLGVAFLVLAFTKSLPASGLGALLGPPAA